MEENKKNKNGVLITIIIILIIVLLGVIGYICYDKGVFGNKVAKTDTEATQVVEAKEVELSDETIRSDLKTKIGFITSYANSEDSLYNAYTFRYKNKIFGDAFNNMNNDLKLEIVLDYLYINKKFQNVTAENKDSEIVKGYGQNEVYQISKDDVNKEYKKFFGKDVSENKSLDIYCFGYDYDATKNMYFKADPNCGGTSGASYVSYINKYTEKENNAYVYVNYGYDGMASDGKVFADLEGTKESSVDPNNFKIDESNYKEFSEYKFTFEKDDSGNYYFVSLEKN